MRIIIFFVSLMMISWVGTAQLSLSEESPGAQMISIKEAFENGQYHRAKSILSEVEAYEEKDLPLYYYYKGRVYQKLEIPGASDFLRRFIRLAPSHPLTGLARLYIGHSYFENAEYGEALIEYAFVADNLLSKEEKEEKYLKEGLSLMALDRSEEAVDKLELARSIGGPYQDQASYHLAYYYHSIGAFQQALGYLSDVENNSSVQVVLLKASILYETKNYKELFEIGDQFLNNRSNEKNRQLSLLVGSAYFNLKDYPSAAKFLQQHVDLSRSVSVDTYYQLGYAQMKSSQSRLAIDNFKQSGLSDRKIGQMSSFYLGKLYLDLNQLNYAYNAFKEASVLDFDQSVQEEASFLIGKVNMDRSLYAAAVEDLSNFLSQFPRSSKKTEANELLAEAYLRTSDYDQAIDHLASIERLNPKLKAAFQQVNFQKGMLLFDDGRFGASIDFLTNAAQSNSDRDMSAESYYWLGEAYTKTGEVEQSLGAYNQSIRSAISPWREKSTYGVAYVYYNRQDYTQAEANFKKFLGFDENLPDPMILDASVRLADCYLVLKKYALAIEAFKRLDRKQSDPYFKYQMGVAYQLADQSENALNQYQSVAGKPSDYQSLAMIQMANIYLDDTNYQEAINVLTRLIQTNQNGQLMPYAYSKRALAYFNLQDYENARNDYLFILNNHLTHEVSNEALLGLQALIQKGIAVKDFESVLAAYQEAHPEDSSLEVIAFEAAKGLYYNQQYDAAVDKLNNFLSKYPQSAFTVDAEYFLADAYMRLSKWAQASAQFATVIANKESPYLIRSLDKRGRALLKLDQYAEAVRNYQLLRQVARNSKESFLAKEGLMNTYVSFNKPDSALFYANQILSADYMPVNAEQSIWMVKAKIFIEQQNYGPAMDELIKIANDAPNERAAEANYLLAKIRYLQGDYKSSLEMLFDLNRRFGSYAYWVGQSFLLIADNYYAMDELLQAKATLQSIIDNSRQEEIVKRAHQKMEQIALVQNEILEVDTIKSDTIK